MSLDTKYRPRSYSDVLGQKVAIKTLKGFVQKDAGWRQSYLFAGPVGSGQTTLGRILARALLCDSPIDGEPCDECDSCLSMLNGSSPNFTEVDAATNSGKADIKKILEELEYSSFSGKKSWSKTSSRCHPFLILLRRIIRSTCTLFLDEIPMRFNP